MEFFVVRIAAGSGRRTLFSIPPQLRLPKLRLTTSLNGCSLSTVIKNCGRKSQRVLSTSEARKSKTKKGKSMYGKILRAIIGCALVSTVLTAKGQLTPGMVLGVSRDVSGTLSVSSVTPGGCPTRVCTTNIITTTHCYTNCFYKLVCTTNSAGQIQCTNVLVCNTRCYTNTYPQITWNECLCHSNVC